MTRSRSFLILATLLLLLAALYLSLRAPHCQKGSSQQISLRPKTPTQTSEQKAKLAKSSAEESRARLVLTAPDLEPLIADAEERDRKKLPFRFATPIAVKKSSSALAPWRFEDGMAHWEFEVEAPGATSLNFAFNQFQLPPGGLLALQSARSEQTITFTSRDNDDHGELWTPIFPGDTVRMVATVPATLLSELRLSLGAVNYGFREKQEPKIGGDISGNCNVDVVCDSGDVSFGDMIDAYRDQIRSVGAYTLSGIDTCSGALINNTAEDSKPYFLTAAHCEINSSNDASIVVYWNFENSTCRPPGSSSSGSVGDGDLAVFNSGSVLRANFSGSDVCLIELDDPVNPDSEAYFAGWNRSSSVPREAVGIHHPAVAEKRISFEFDPLRSTFYYGTSSTSSGTHLRVADWDQGTTEGGSSGSPLFNAAGQIVGQLHGGDAACGNDDSDWYGRFFVSWTGGGTSSSRLSNWLAPSGTPPTSLDGKELDIRLEAADLAVNEGDSGSTTATVTVSLSAPASNAISFTLTPDGGTASVGSDYVDPGPQVVTITPPQTSATIDFQINGDTTPEENETISISYSNVTGARTPSQPISLVILNDDFIVPEITSSLTLDGNDGNFLGYQIEALNTPTSFGLSNEPAGMTVDTASGLIAWPDPVMGTYMVTISASNQQGSSSETLTIEIAESLLKPAFEIPSTVTLGGDVSNWKITTSDTFDGEDALLLDDASDGSDTRLTLSLTGPDELTFWWKCSTEYDFDLFSVSLDGATQHVISGETNWHSESLSIPAGNHVVEFRYERNNQFDGGFNTVALDRFTLESTARPVFEQPSPLYIPNGSDVSLALTTYPEGEIEVASLPWNWRLDEGAHLLGRTTSNFSFTSTASNDQGDTTRNFEVVPFISSGSLEAALDQANFPLRSPAPAFFSQSTIRTTGSSAAKSATMSSEGRSEMTAYAVGPGTLRFQWRVSSEVDFDYGYFLLNGSQVAVDSGNNSTFSEVVVPLPYGLNELTWLYVKDETISENLDSMYVDNVRLEGFARWVFDNGSTPFETPPGGGIDGDENAGLLEYAVGLDPASNEAPHLLELTGSVGNWTLSTPLNNTATGITASIQKSSDLNSDPWSDLTMEAAPLGTTLSIQDNSGDARAFYRLEVTAP